MIRHSKQLARFTIALAAVQVAVPSPGRAQVSARQARVEVVAPKAPTPAFVNEQRVLVYELHVTNFGGGPLVLRQLDIMDAARPDTLLLSYHDSALRGVVRPAGLMGSTSGTRLEPGFRAVVFLWLPLAPHQPTPAMLRHRMLFDIADSADAHRDHGTQSAIDTIMVPVSSGAALVLPAPLRGGEWLAASAPSNTSDHRRSLIPIDGRIRISQRFAIDWNMVGPNGNTFRGDEHQNTSYWGFGQSVHSVATGRVVAVLDTVSDRVPHAPLPPVTLANIGGNYVVIRIGPDRFAFYGHLKRGSIRVRPQQEVSAGYVIGLVGNSGQTSAPHLHFQIADAPSFLDSEGVPYVLEAYTDLGPGKDFEEDKHPETPRRRTLPVEDEVVGLP